MKGSHINKAKPLIKLFCQRGGIMNHELVAHFLCNLQGGDHQHACNAKSTGFGFGRNSIDAILSSQSKARV